MRPVKSNKRATIAEVAEAAGVSRTTVSHVISGNRPVAEETRKRVSEVIVRLGYRPNSLARSLRIQRSHTIAVIVPDITNPFYPVMTRGLDDAFAGDYRALICSTDAKRERELAFAADAYDRNADGIVIVAFQIDADDLADIIGSGIPMVSMGEAIDHPDVDIVLKEDERGAFEATKYLIEKGHTRIGHVGGTAGPGHSREAGYRRAMDEAGLGVTPDMISDGAWNRSGGGKAMHQLIEATEGTSAVFCGNDLMAIGALDCARELGLDVPEDIAVVGFDDIESAALVTPALTTMTNPAYESGMAAGKLLLDRIEGARPSARRIVVMRPELVERESA